MYVETRNNLIGYRLFNTKKVDNTFMEYDSRKYPRSYFRVISFRRKIIQITWLSYRIWIKERNEKNPSYCTKCILHLWFKNSNLKVDHHTGATGSSTAPNTIVRMKKVHGHGNLSNKFFKKKVRRQKHTKNADKGKNSLPCINHLIMSKHCQHPVQNNHCPEMKGQYSTSFLLSGRNIHIYAHAL